MVDRFGEVLGCFYRQTYNIAYLMVNVNTSHSTACLVVTLAYHNLNVCLHGLELNI